MKEQVFRGAIDIQASPAKIFEFLTDPALGKRWVPGLVDLNETSPGVLAGAGSTATYRLNGRTMRVTERVIESEAPNRITSEIAMPGFAMIQRMRLQERSEKITHLETELEVKPFGLHGALSKIATTNLDAQLNLGLKRLKAVVEDPDMVLAPVERIPVKYSLLGVATFVVVTFAIGFLAQRIFS